MTLQDNKKGEIKLKGIAASPGIAIGKILIMGHDHLKVSRQKISQEEIEREIDKFYQAIEKAKFELESLVNKSRKAIGEEGAKIFKVHQTMLEDPMVLEETEKNIRKEQKSADRAFKDSIEKFESALEEMKTEYFRTRTADLQDLKRRIIGHIQESSPSTINQLTEPAIVFAKELTPSDTVALDADKVLGFAMDFGGRTSHATIVARSMKVPAVVGLHTAHSYIQEGDLVILDGNIGTFIVNPNSKTRSKYQKRLRVYEEFIRRLDEARDLPARTKDGKDIELSSNIEFPMEVENVLSTGGKGIGLYRTEYLYLADTELPSEEEQFIEYKKILEKLKGQPVIIRTFDLGGDKPPKSIKLPAERNPFLGLRGARLYSDLGENLFRTQLRAILRASVHGNPLIMFPMITCVHEMRFCQNVLDKVREELSQEGHSFAEHIPVGAMIEVPAAALIADLIARECDFLSIGTNDLVQYTTAVDRGNENISYLYQTFNPAVVRFIREIIQKGHEQGKWVGMCGEMASDPLATMMLIGMGLDEFSVSPVSLLLIKEIIRRVDVNECENLVEKVFSYNTTAEIEDYLRTVYQKKFKNLVYRDLLKST